MIIETVRRTNGMIDSPSKEMEDRTKMDKHQTIHPQTPAAGI